MPWRKLGCVAVITSILWFWLFPWDSSGFWERFGISIVFGYISAGAYGLFWAMIQKFRGKLG